jgi:hypothetical protein
VNLGPSVVNILEAAMFVVREPVDFSRAAAYEIEEDAGRMATANSIRT